MKRLLRLGTATSLLVGVLAAGPLLVGAFWMERELQQQAHRELHRSAEALARTLAAPAALPLPAGFAGPVPAAVPEPTPAAAATPAPLPQWTRAASLRRIVVYGRAGQVLHEVQAAADGRAGALAAQPRSLPVLQLEDLAARSAAGAPLRAQDAALQAVVPLPGGTPAGWLQVERDAAVLDADLSRLRRHAGLAALGALALALLTLRLTHARTARAIAAATALAQQPLREGTPRRLPADSGPQEVRALHRALNDLALQLADSRAALDEREARLRGALDGALDAILTIDEQGRVVDFNRAAEKTFGYLRAEVLGKPVSEAIVPPQHRAAHAAGLEHWARGGQELRRRMEFEAQRADGTLIPVQMSLASTSWGERRYVTATLRDLAEPRRQGDERERILRSYKKLSARLERLKLALDEHAIVCITNARGQITYANRKLAELTGYERHEFLGQTHRILQSGLQDPAIYEELWRTVEQGDVWHGELADRRRDGSLYWVACTIVPMGAGEPEGPRYVSVQTDITAQKQAERALAEARRAELETGSHIQKTLLLGELRPQTGGWWISTHSEPSLGIDGDFFDVLHLSEHCIDLLIADVMGKGVPAALVGAGTKMQFSRSIAELMWGQEGGAQPPAPSRIVAAVHQAMTPKLQALGSFVTLCYLRLDLKRRELVYVGCGHEETLLLRRDGSMEALPNQHPPLGILDQEDYVETRVSLGGGDALFLSSDGVVDLVNPAGERWGAERMRATLRRIVAAQPGVAACLQRMRCEMRDFEAGAAHSDDVTMLLLRVPDEGEAAAPCARMEFERDAARLQRLRRFVRGAAQRCGLGEDDTAALELAVVESVTNIIRHADTPLPDAPIEVFVSERAGHCVVELVYLGSPFDPGEVADPDFSGHSEGGFGLYIISHSCDRVEHRHRDGVNTVALHKRLAGPR